jgi:hypothetical protein
MFESKLLSDVITDAPVFWAGKLTPSAGVTNSLALFDEACDFRLPASEHGRFAAVYLVEYDLAQYKQWPLILDEALRLFQYGQRGALFVRFTETALLSAFAFAAFLRRRTDFTFELEYQDASLNGVISYCIRCQREERAPALSSFEFALITDGKRPDAVARFAASVAAIRGIEMIDWSIAVCGPAEFGKQLATASKAIRYIDAPVEHETRGWITRKKNLIVSTSGADNLLIAHDRYEMSNAFLEQMFEFGADFSVVVPAQRDDSGDAFPDWVTIGSQWSKTPCAMLEYGDYSPHAYVNGGVIIGKRHVLAANPWSELLFWGQYEDVELSRAMTANGITPRLARQVQLRVTAMRPGYVHDFARLPNVPGTYVASRAGTQQAEMPMGEFPIGTTLNFDGMTTERILAHAGVAAARSDWTTSEVGLVFRRRVAKMSIALPSRGTRGLFLTVHTPAHTEPPQITVKANGTFVQLRWTESKTGTRSGSAWIDSTISPSARNVDLLFSTDTDAVSLTALGLAAQDAGGSRNPLGYARVDGMVAGLFREGWGEPETWGIWTVAAEAHLQLPVANLSAERDIELNMTATAFGPSAGFPQIVGIACNGIPLTCVTITSLAAPAQFLVRIPRILIRNTPTIQLTFRPAFPCTPTAANLGLDGRMLGFGLIALDARAA